MYGGEQEPWISCPALLLTQPVPRAGCLHSLRSPQLPEQHNDPLPCSVMYLRVSGWENVIIQREKGLRHLEVDNLAHEHRLSGSSSKEPVTVSTVRGYLGALNRCPEFRG